MLHKILHRLRLLGIATASVALLACSDSSGRPSGPGAPEYLPVANPEVSLPPDAVTDAADTAVAASFLLQEDADAVIAWAPEQWRSQTASP